MVRAKLVSVIDQEVRIGKLGMNLSIGEREFVQIGQMRKFEPDHIVNLADEQGYVCKASYFDEEMPFVLCLFRFGD